MSERFQRLGYTVLIGALICWSVIGSLKPSYPNVEPPKQIKQTRYVSVKELLRNTDRYFDTIVIRGLVHNYDEYDRKNNSFQIADLDAGAFTSKILTVMFEGEKPSPGEIVEVKGSVRLLQEFEPYSSPRQYLYLQADTVTKINK